MKIRMEKHKCNKLSMRLSILMTWKDMRISAVSSEALVGLSANIFKIAGQDTY